MIDARALCRPAFSLRYAALYRWIMGIILCLLASPAIADGEQVGGATDVAAPPMVLLLGMVVAGLLLGRRKPR